MNMASEMTQRAGLALLSTQINYTGGEIQFTLVLVNLRNDQLVVNFPTDQLFDFIVSLVDGTKLWQWSDGRTFNPTIVTIGVNPQKFHAIDPPDPIILSDILPAGVQEFTVTGVLTSDSLPGNVSLTLNVL